MYTMKCEHDIKIVSVYIKLLKVKPTILLYEGNPEVRPGSFTLCA